MERDRRSKYKETKGRNSKLKQTVSWVHLTRPMIDKRKQWPQNKQITKKEKIT